MFGRTHEGIHTFAKLEPIILTKCKTSVASCNNRRLCFFKAMVRFLELSNGYSIGSASEIPDTIDSNEKFIPVKIRRNEDPDARKCSLDEGLAMGPGHSVHRSCGDSTSQRVIIQEN